VYEKAGCPYNRDVKGKIWINGKGFATWYKMTYAKIVLGKDESYCRTCGMAVGIVNPEYIQKASLKYLKFKCPGCGRVLIRFITNRRKTAHSSENQTGGCCND